MKIINSVLKSYNDENDRKKFLMNFNEYKKKAKLENSIKKHFYPYKFCVRENKKNNLD